MATLASPQHRRHLDDRRVRYPLGASIRIEELQHETYRVLTLLQAAEPVSWIDSLGVWYVTRCDDVREVLGNPSLFTTDSEHSLVKDTLGPQMLSSDGPQHVRYKTQARPMLQPGQIRARLEEGIEACADRLIDGFQSAGTADLRVALARRLPVQTMLRLFGLPAEREADLRGWYDHFEAALGNLLWDPDVRAAGRASVADLHSMLMQHLRREPAGTLDMLAQLSGSRADQALSDEEVCRNASIILFGGISTVEAIILNTLWALLTHPDALSQVRQTGNVAVASAVEETLRWRSPVQSATRHVVADCSFRGAAFLAGETVNCMLGAANRDPLVFRDPDAFDIRRSNLREHLAFAYGPHHCLGSHLARAEARIAVGKLLERLPNITLIEPGEAPRGIEFHQPHSLWVRWQS